MLWQAAGIITSCIYEGHVQHRRLSPIAHRFSYALYMLYVDLAEWPALAGSGIGLRTAFLSPVSFRREDHLGDPAVPLAQAVHDLVRARTGWRPAGPVRLLTLPRNVGYYFSPLNLYFCFDGSGVTVEAVVAEVTNTPWLERHWYVLWEGNRIGGPQPLRFRHPKDFHVSPFMDMDAQYEWQLSPPGERLGVFIASLSEGRRFFDVSLALERRELNRGTLRRTLARHPWMTARVTQAIYWQALGLWLKRSPFHAHPAARIPDDGRRPW
jgi:hypothetical protein